MGEQLPLFGSAAPADPFADVYEKIEAVPERCPDCGGQPKVTLDAAPPQWPNIVLAHVGCTFSTCTALPVLLDLKVSEREQWPRILLAAWLHREPWERKNDD